MHKVHEIRSHSRRRDLGPIDLNICVIAPVSLADSGRQIGGTKTYTCGLVAWLRRSHHQVHFVGIGATSCGEGDLSVFSKERCGTLSFLIRLTLSSLRIRKLHPDIVNVQLVLAAIPFLVAKRWRVVVTMHGSPERGISFRRGRAIGAAYSLVESLILRHADKIVFVDRESKRNYERKYGWLKHKSEFIPVAVDLDLFRPLQQETLARTRARYQLAGYRLVCAYVGRLSTEKRVAPLIRIFARASMQDTVFQVIGSGPEEETLRKLIVALGVEHRVRILPGLPRREIAGRLGCSDIFLLASEFEGFPIAALEALASGVLVVARDVGELQSLLQDRRVGCIVDSDEAMHEYLVETAPEASRGGSSPDREARRAAVESYSWDSIGQRLLGVYRELLDLAS